MLVPKSITRKSARCILLLLAVAAFAGGYLGRKPHIAGITQDAESSDANMYQNVVRRVHAGEGYYQVIGDELRSQGYAVSPFFNWRLPTLLWSLGKLPHSVIGQGVLIALVVGVLVVWLPPLKVTLGFPITCLAALIVGAPMLGLAGKPGWYFQHTLWGGVLIALSMGVHRRNVNASVVCGLAALAIRELALPYVVIMLVFAIREKKKKEALAWAAGIVAFGIFLAVHAAIVSRHALPTDLRDPSWVRFSGWPHTVACANWMFLGVAPYWLAGAVLIFAFFGAICSGDRRLAAIVILYCAAFAVAGKPFNTYWGLMYTTLLAVSFTFSIRGVIDYARVAFLVPKAAAPPTGDSE